MINILLYRVRTYDKRRYSHCVWIKDRKTFTVEKNTNTINQVTRLNEIAIKIVIHEGIIFYEDEVREIY